MNAYAQSVAEENDICFLWKLSKKIDNKALEQKWEFQGEFSSNKIPALLNTLIKWMLLGLHIMNLGEGTETCEAYNIIKTTS